MPSDVTLDGRSRRPPRDLPNAALSYGYAILLSECVGALHAAGLEPSLGVAHAPTDKRPSLALDLMEQFRPLLVDQTVMALLRTRKLRPEHGVVEGEAGGVWLGGDGKKILVDAYEAACQRSVTGALPRYSGVVAQAHRPLRADAGARHRRTRLPMERGRLAMIYIIAYDKCRLRVAGALEAWCYRIQESVFQLHLDNATLARVLGSLPSSQTPKTSSSIYPICSSCTDRADILGAAIALDDVGLCRGVW